MCARVYCKRGEATCYFHNAAAREENVCAFEITVHNVVGMDEVPEGGGTMKSCRGVADGRGIELERGVGFRL